jgi:hypothetical protein
VANNERDRAEDEALDGTKPGERDEVEAIENEGEDEQDDKAQVAEIKVKQADWDRINAELKQAKKNAIALQKEVTRLANDAKGQSEKVEATIEQELTTLRERNARLLEKQRKAQVLEEARNYLLSEDKYQPWLVGAEYIAKDVATEDVTIVDDRYDPDELREEIERAALKYMKLNPRTTDGRRREARAIEDAADAASPSRNRAAGEKPQAVVLSELDDKYGGLLSRMMQGPVSQGR